MKDIKDLKGYIQEWFNDCTDAVEVAKTYAEIQKENEKQLEFMLDQFISVDEDCTRS